MTEPVTFSATSDTSLPTAITKAQVKMILDVIFEYLKRRIGRRPFVLAVLTGLWSEISDGIVEELITYLKAHGYASLFA